MWAKAQGGELIDELYICTTVSQGQWAAHTILLSPWPLRDTGVMQLISLLIMCENTWKGGKEERTLQSNQLSWLQRTVGQCEAALTLLKPSWSCLNSGIKTTALPPLCCLLPSPISTTQTLQYLHRLHILSCVHRSDAATNKITYSISNYVKSIDIETSLRRHQRMDLNQDCFCCLITMTNPSCPLGTHFVEYIKGWKEKESNFILHFLDFLEAMTFQQ